MTICLHGSFVCLVHHDHLPVLLVHHLDQKTHLVLHRHALRDLRKTNLILKITAIVSRIANLYVITQVHARSEEKVITQVDSRREEKVIRQVDARREEKVN